MKYDPVEIERRERKERKRKEERKRRKQEKERLSEKVSWERAQSPIRGTKDASSLDRSFSRLQCDPDVKRPRMDSHVKVSPEA